MHHLAIRTVIDTSAFKRRTVALPGGRKAERVVTPGFRRALELLQSGQADGLLALDLDRIARDPRDLEDLIDVVESHTPHVPVESVTGSLRLANEPRRSGAYWRGRSASSASPPPNILAARHDGKPQLVSLCVQRVTGFLSFDRGDELVFRGADGGLCGVPVGVGLAGLVQDHSLTATDYGGLRIPALAQ